MCTHASLCWRLGAWMKWNGLHFKYYFFQLTFFAFWNKFIFCLLPKGSINSKSCFVQLIPRFNDDPLNCKGNRARWLRDSFPCWFNKPYPPRQRWVGIIHFHYHLILTKSWWRHGMETLSALMALYAGNHWSYVVFPKKGSTIRSTDIFLILSLNKLLKQQWICRWFETQRRSYDVTTVMATMVTGTLSVLFVSISFLHSFTIHVFTQNKAWNSCNGVMHRLTQFGQVMPYMLSLVQVMDCRTYDIKSLLYKFCW